MTDPVEQDSAALRSVGSGHNHAYGLSGIGPRLPLLLSAAMAGRFTITQVARLASENSAQAFGRRPNKGALPQGSDADAVISDHRSKSVLLADGFGDGRGGSLISR